MYDFAHSAFGTLVVTFIFSAYYARSIATDPIEGAIWWTRAVNASAIITALIMPVVGAVGDFGGLKKRFLLIATAVCVALTAGLFRMGPGDAWIAALVFVGASVAYESLQSLANAFLPELSTRENMGRISGLGWGLGYFGGLLCLILALGMVTSWLPETGGLNVRATNLLAAGWLLAFSIPTFLYLRERQPRRRASFGTYVRMGFGRIGETARDLRRYRQAIRLLIARLVYNDGLTTAFTMAAIYAAAEFGMETADLLVLGIVVNATGGRERDRLRVRPGSDRRKAHDRDHAGAPDGGDGSRLLRPNTRRVLGRGHPPGSHGGPQPGREPRAARVVRAQEQAGRTVRLLRLLGPVGIGAGTALLRAHSRRHGQPSLGHRLHHRVPRRGAAATPTGGRGGGRDAGGGGGCVRGIAAGLRSATDARLFPEGLIGGRSQCVLAAGACLDEVYGGVTCVVSSLRSGSRDPPRGGGNKDSDEDGNQAH